GLTKTSGSSHRHKHSSEVSYPRGQTVQLSPEVLRVEDVRWPQPVGNEGLIRVRALALSRLDLLWREGSYCEEPQFPAQIGYEAAGVVESVRPEVTSFKVGERFPTFPAVSLTEYAAHGETILCPESALLAYPQNLTPEQAAAANIGLFTAYFALVELARLKPDQHVVVSAAGSSMGVAALQMVKAVGAKSIAVTRSEGKQEGLLAAGPTRSSSPAVRMSKRPFSNAPRGLGPK